MATTVSLINMKGGVGKSTLTVNLAWHFAGYSLAWAKKVLVIDLDPQFNASQYLLGVKGYEKILNDGKPMVWDIFEQFTQVPGKTRKPLKIEEVIRPIKSWSDGARIDLIPSSLELAFSLRNPGQKDRLLELALRPVKDNYDLILIDCPPTDSVFTTAAYLSSNFVVVPVKPEYLSSIGLPLLVNSMNTFANEYPDNQLDLAGVIFNGTSGYSPEENLSKKDVTTISNKNGWYIFKNEVPFSRSFPKGAREGEPLFRTSYRRSKKAGQFAAVAEEFAKQVGL
ncbi:MAG: ParA family protein [Luteolibacter sp.]